MEVQTYHYEELTATQLADLDRGRTLALWKTLPRTAVPDDAGPRQLLASVAGLVGRLGKERLARDLAHLGSTLGWLAMEPMSTYMGAPGEASAEAGERMMEAHAAEAMTMLEEAKAGQPGL